MSRDNRRFGRGGTYTCRVCHKRTRETGEGESSVKLCVRCYNKAGQENSHSDNHEGRMSNCAECRQAAQRDGFTIDSPAWCDKEDDTIVLTDEQLAAIRKVIGGGNVITSVKLVVEAELASGTGSAVWTLPTVSFMAAR